MPTPSTLPRHLALALNIRGIGVYDPTEPPDREFFTWLARKHQYRNVGFPPTLLDHPDVDIEGYQTFEPAAFPLPGLEGFTGRVTEAPAWVVESLLVSSAFVSPLFIHRPALGAFEPFVIWRLDSAPALPEDQVLRHMRIAGYGLLDFFEAMAASGYEAVLAGNVDDERQSRTETAAEDGAERFWRLREEVTGETWVGGYFDALPAFAGDEAAIEALNADPDLMVGLGLVGGFAIDPPYD